MSRVAIITPDRVGRRMAGPAIRAWAMASHLSRRNQVRLLVPSEVMALPGQPVTFDIAPDTFELIPIRRSDLVDHVGWAEIIIFQGNILHRYPSLIRTDRALVADLYDPFHLENLEVARSDVLPERQAKAAHDLDVLDRQLRTADLFLCASEKQRDFWLGHLAAAGRIGPQTYDADPSLRRLIEVVPFGIPSEPPMRRRSVLRGVHPGIADDDVLLLWGGGVYNWFDPPTLIRAVDILRRTQENVRLYFLGMRHPNPEVPAMRMAAETVALAKDLSLVGSHVFFNEDWVPYEERGDYLLEADIGVSTHLEHVETAYSYRTRVLDYFWAGLPVVVTRGDALGALVERRGLGRTVPPEDPQGLADVLGSMLADQEVLAECRRNIEHVRPELTWDRALAPLASFCEQPGRAPDLPADRKEIRLEGDLPETVRIVGRALYYARVGGWPTVRRHAANYLKGGRRRRR